MVFDALISNEKIIIMKKNILILFILTLVISGFYACKKEIKLNSTAMSPSGKAFIKVIDYAPSFRLVTSNRDSFNVFVNNIKINGAFLSYNSAYPNSINDTYAAVPPGAQTIRLAVNGVNTPDSITIATFNKTVNAGEYYTLILTDSLLNNTESSQIWVKDNATLTDTGHFSLRFVHAVLNDTAGKSVDIFSQRNLANIFSNVTPSTATSFNQLPYTTLSDTLIVRRAGTLNELARLSGAAFTRQRAYTLVYKGNGNLPSSNVKGRNLTFYVNQ